MTQGSKENMHFSTKSAERHHLQPQSSRWKFQEDRTKVPCSNVWRHCCTKLKGIGIVPVLSTMEVGLSNMRWSWQFNFQLLLYSGYMSAFPLLPFCGLLELSWLLRRSFPLQLLDTTHHSGCVAVYIYIDIYKLESVRSEERFFPHIPTFSIKVGPMPTLCQI